jgi:ABC-type transport system involved in multi-copper enzyme maturation permease subunit
MKIDFKWVGIGTIVIIVLAYIGLIAGAVAGSLAVSYLFIFLSYFAGGVIIGKKSPGRTIIEPGIASAIASFLPGISGLGIIVSFLMGVAGGYVGEKWQDSEGRKVQAILTRETAAETRFCPSCGKPMTYIPEYQAYYCHNCQKYPEIEVR